MPFVSLRKRHSRVFGSRTDSLLPCPLVSPTETSPPPTRGPLKNTLRKLRASISGLLERFRPHQLPDMDGSSQPHHRTASLPQSVLSERPLPQRKRSVRFLGFSDIQLDGHNSESQSTIRRSISKKKPNPPCIQTHFDGMASSSSSHEERSPDTPGSSSSPSSRGANATWSPDSGTASTAATSFTTSPTSSGARHT